MVESCSATNCTNRRKKGTKMKFHRIPKDSHLRKLWLLAIRRVNFNPSETTVICEKHFKLEDYEMNFHGNKVLKKTAVPSKFDIPARLKKEVKTRKPLKRKLEDSNSEPGERVMPTLETMSLDDDTDNSSTLHNEFIIKEETSMQSLSNTPTILGCSSKVSRSMSPNNNLNSVDILEDIKTHNRNIEVEYVDIKMENEDDIDQIVDEPNNVIDYITSSDLVDDLVETVNEPNNVIDDNTSDDLVGVGSSLEAKYNDLYKENQILKHLLTKIGLFPNLECSGEYTINTESNHLIDLTDIQNICRVCLQKSDNLIVVNEQIVFENKNIPNMTILEALQSIICDKVDNADNLPHQICTQCRNHLKSCVMFKHTFNRATSILHILSNVMFVNTNKQSIPASTMEDYDYSKNNSLKDEKSCTLELETSENYTNTDDMSVLSKNSEDSSKLRSPARKKMFRHKVKKQMNILHTCPICRTKMSTSKLIQHVKSHKTLEKYLSIRKVSSKTGFYAPVRDVQGLLIEEGETLHKCPICRYECKATEFILHVHHHLTNDQFKCEKCHCSFKKKSNLLSHMLVHSKTFPFRCMECGKGFVVKSNYERHLLTHEDGELPHKCIECGKSFSNPRHLSRHMTVHTENWTYSTKYRFKRCKYCGEGFLKKEQLVEHICHQYGVFKCKFCFKVFLNSRTRQLHTHKVHFNGKKTSGFCSICRLMFKNINYHKALKHPKANLKELCTVCGLYVTNIYIHMLKHRNVLSTQNYQCPICSKLFSYRTSLEKHLTIHSGVKPYISSP